MMYTAFTCGILYECFIPGGANIFGIGIKSNVGFERDLITSDKKFIMDIHAMKAYMPFKDSPSSTYICMASVEDIGRFIGAALDLPHWPRVLGLYGERISVEEIVETAERLTGLSLSIRSYR